MMPISVRDVDVDHYDAPTTALANLVRTSIGEHTYAEIISTAQAWYEVHHHLCRGTLEAARLFRAHFRSENLSLVG